MNNIINMNDKNLFTYFFKKELTEVENKCNFDKCEDIIKLTIEHLYNEFCVFGSITKKTDSNNDFPNSAIISSINENLFVKYFKGKYLLDDKIYSEDEIYSNHMGFYSFLLDLSGLIDQLSNLESNIEGSFNDIKVFIDEYFKEIIPNDELFNIQILNDSEISAFLEITNGNNKVNELELISDVFKAIIFELIFNSIKAKLIVYKVILNYIPFNQDGYKEKIIQDIINLLTQDLNE